MPASKKILYIDLDNTLVNFQSGIDRLTDSVREKYKNDLDEAPHIFSRMDPLDGAIDAYHQLATAIRHLHPLDSAVEERHSLARQGSVGPRAPRNGGRQRRVQTSDPLAPQTPQSGRLPRRRPRSKRSRSIRGRVDQVRQHQVSRLEDRHRTLVEAGLKHEIPAHACMSGGFRGNELADDLAPDDRLVAAGGRHRCRR